MSQSELASDKKRLLDAALKAGEWLLANQVTDRTDANRGRGIRSFDLRTGHTVLTGNWPTGTQCMCMLALYRRTGDERYLTAAEFAGRYIMSLQVLDQRDTEYYGTIREITPQSIEFAPRDSTTAAWALVWLYKATKNPLYLDRAVLFGRWHMEHAMFNGWPRYSCYMDDEIEGSFWHGSFQSGTGLFYYDLFMACQDPRFIERGFAPIARKYRDDFFEDDGQIIMNRDGFTGEVEHEEYKMHLYNDDFGNAMLQTAAEFFKDESYRQAAYKNARWLADHQLPEGGFGDDYCSGVPVSLMYFHDLGLHYNDANLLAARDKALAKVLSLQVSETGEKRIDGAFRGRYEGPKDAPGGGEVCVNNRTTTYAVMALVKLESEVKDIWLGRHNKRFEDRNHGDAIPNLVW